MKKERMSEKEKDLIVMKESFEVIRMENNQNKNNQSRIVESRRKNKESGNSSKRKQ